MNVDDEAERGKQDLRTRIELEGFGMKGKVFGIDLQTIINVGTMTSLVFIGLMISELRKDIESAKIGGNATTMQMIDALKQLTAAQKFSTCINAQPESLRNEEYNKANGLCAQMGKVQ